MPKTEAEIARPYQLELDKARRELLEQKQTSIKELNKFADALEEKDTFYTAQIEEMREAVQTMSPDKVAALEKGRDEAAQKHRQAILDLRREMAYHQATKEQLDAANGTISTMNGSIANYKLEIAELEKKIPTANAPGRTRTRRSRRS
jgi:hypothetical protein